MVLLLKIIITEQFKFAKKEYYIHRLVMGKII